MNHIIYMFSLLVWATCFAYLMMRVISRISNPLVKIFSGAIVGFMMFPGDYILMGVTDDIPLRDHFVFPKLYALLSYCFAGAVIGALLPFVRKKEANKALDPTSGNARGASPEAGQG